MQRIVLSVSLVVIACLFWFSAARVRASTEVHVTLSEFEVAMSDQRLPAGVPVSFVILNNGKIEHELVFEHAGAVDEPIEANGQELEAEKIQPGETRTVEWTIPAGGDYQFACHVPGHFEAGMKALFSAAAPAASAATAPAAPAATTAPAQAPLPKTGLDVDWRLIALLGVAALLALAGGLALRRRKA